MVKALKGYIFIVSRERISFHSVVLIEILLKKKSEKKKRISFLSKIFFIKLKLSSMRLKIYFKKKKSIEFVHLGAIDILQDGEGQTIFYYFLFLHRKKLLTQILQIYG